MKQKTSLGTDHVPIMQTFTITDLPDLDVCVVASLEALSAQKLPSSHFPSYKRPLVIGSGNAAATGKILFHDCDAVFADESSYVEKLEKIKDIDGVILISASGGKHAPGIAKNVQQWDKPFYLLTNNPNSIAARSLSPKQILVFPKNREPYTYNVSTYMSMILAKTREDPKKILDFITTTIDSIALPDFSSYGAFCVIIPPQFLEIKEMLDKKFVELFGRKIAYTISTPEFMKHATTVVSRPDELFISFGYDNTQWGKHRLAIPLPPTADYAAMMAIGYYLIGKIQKANHPWFKESIAAYCKESSKIFGQDVQPIVE
ncbi:MAG TPA: hypothetical protein VJI15_01100 [Candidatus Nanoarchaeia archaeon]|nr:hypothetical protein [Candidatus Nanoarchaeia archaeon]